MAKLTAVIDIGSNSVRLVIFERTSRFGFHTIHESKSRVRIGEGAYNKGGVLQDEPMERAYFALQSFSSIIQSFKVRKTLAIATSALRDAPNRSVFINRIRKDFGIGIKVIDGKREAYFGGVACANLLQVDSRSTTIDIGGGSTEFALIEGKKVIETHSLNLGSVRLKEFFDETTPDFKGAREYISAILDTLPESFYQSTVIGIGGTIRALSKMIAKDNSYPMPKIHGYSFEYYGTYRSSLNSILEMNNLELISAGIKRERIDVIRWGTLIFLEVLNRFHSDRIISSGVGIREGLFLTDILRNSNHQFPNNFNPSLRTMLDQFKSHYPNQSMIGDVSKRIFDLTKHRLELDNSYRKHITYASKLIGTGIDVDFYGKTKNGFYLILNRLIYQIDHKDTILIAFLVRYNRKWDIPKKSYGEFFELLPKLETVKKLNTILSLASTLLSHYPKDRDMDIDLIGDTITVKTSDYAKYIIEERLADYKPEEFFKIEIFSR